MRKYSLRYQLVLPFVLLMLLVPTGIGWMLYASGTAAVNSLARRVLHDVVRQINVSTEQHLTAALNALNSFAPEMPHAGNSVFSTDMATLEDRVWKTSAQATYPGSYIYFGGKDGRFIGLYRINSYLMEMYKRPPGAAKRSIYAIKHAGDRPTLLRTDDYDPHSRPWYKSATQHDRPVWSPVYNDFTSSKPTITVAKPIRNASNGFLGVAASDVELHSLTERLMSLAISQNGIAFMMDSKGFIIASSEQEPAISRRASNSSLRHASEMESPLIRASHDAILAWRKDARHSADTLEQEIDTEHGMLNMAASTVGHSQGVDWITAVVAPRSDFIADMTRSFNRSLLISGFCVLVSLVLGMVFLNRVLRDIYALNHAAQKIGLGENSPPLKINRDDELGQLARSFNEMEHNLRTDKLTGVFNRAFMVNRVRSMVEQSSNPLAARQQFALLFIDLDDFKSINDQFGHATGDAVLIEIASRLKMATRASDSVVRYGGDEFVVLLNDVTSEEAIAATEEKILALVEAPIAVDHGEILPGISIGWALFPKDGDNAEKLLKVADGRMFAKKKTRKTMPLFGTDQPLS